MIRFPAYAVIAVVLLRLLCGWHFYNEGVKKLDPGFSSAGFLRGSIGPMAPTFKKLAAGPYGAYELLGTPVETGTRSDEDQAAIDAWMAKYADQMKRRDRVYKANNKALEKGEPTKPLPPLPTSMDPAVPGAAWVEAITEGWNSGLERLDRLGAEDATAIRDAKLQEVVYYLWGQYDAIEELQHEAWRLERMKSKAGADPVDFQRERIAVKDREVWSAIRPWVAAVQQIEDDFISEVAAANEGVSASRITNSLQERSFLSWADTLVTAVVLGGGILVFLGLATRLAAVACAGFLLSLIMTQPPWVVGADLGAFFTWAIELAAFLVLAAVGAGRWAGVDGVLHQMRLRWGDLSPKYEALREPKAAA